MRVKRDFNQIYRDEDDPWAIGAADSERYALYRDLIRERKPSGDAVLDIGCGFGAFLAHFRDTFRRLDGVDVSALAIEKGRRRFPSIRFLQGSAAGLDRVPDLGGRYDLIVYSDVICYLDEAGRNASLRWISEHLADDGLAFVAAWTPGGHYLDPGELERLVRRHLRLEKERILKSGHSLFLSRRRRRLVAVTLDYETWHPIPPGRTIDWEADVFRPTSEFLRAADAGRATLTLMVEAGEYLWLRRNEPAIAARMERQWQEALRCGHDVQLHLHPSWLPELGARREAGAWAWDWSRAKAADYPFDLKARIAECRAALESALRPVDPSYRVAAFRAGAYQAQPFPRLYDALVAAGIGCDSSVHAGGRSEERGYDYRLAFSRHQPYFAGRHDPQLLAPPDERGIVELPLFAWRPGERWTLDGPEGGRFAVRLLAHLEKERARFLPTEAYRRAKNVRAWLGLRYASLRPLRFLLNQLIPRGLAHILPDYPPPPTGHEYFVLIGHTKGEHDFPAIAAGLRSLARDGGAEIVSLSAMARIARSELEGAAPAGASDSAAWQVRREFQSIMGSERNEAQSRRLQDMIPLDRDRVLDLGCGAGYWAAAIARRYPWMQVEGIDYGAEFLAKAGREHRLDRARFLRGDIARLPFRDGSFDCVYADNTLEHSFSVSATLSEVNRVLRPGGVLVAALPSDARNPRRICDNHTWKTAPCDVRARLLAAGFRDIFIEEIDTYRGLGMPPYPPSDDLMIYVRATRRSGAGAGGHPGERPEDAPQMGRAREAMEWVYRALRPERSSEGNDPVAILAGGTAFCWGYAVVLGEILRREGFDVRWLSMLARDHPRGRGEDRVDSHEVVLARCDGDEVILDPMSNTAIPHPFFQVLRRPGLAVPKSDPDERYVTRGYSLYSTDFWYGRVVKYALRSDPSRRPRWRRRPA
ncbi:MAG: methyltransferase domain-containing protein [Acidobacteria bacterium]|nr:methyltransferase domain-containing protein [Acidobacteriota bacterium]